MYHAYYTPIQYLYAHYNLANIHSHSHELAAYVVHTNPFRYGISGHC